MTASRSQGEIGIERSCQLAGISRSGYIGIGSDRRRARKRPGCATPFNAWLSSTATTATDGLALCSGEKAGKPITSGCCA
jgi:hypothetical protein